MSSIIFISIFVIIFFIAVRVGISMSAEGKVSRKRVAGLVAEDGDDDGFSPADVDFSNEGKSAFADALEGATGAFRRNISRQEEDEISIKLYRAGVRSKSGRSYYMFFRTFGWLFGLIVFGIFYIVAKKLGGGFVLPVVLVGIINGGLLTFGAKLWLKNNTEKRHKILLRSFPDMLDLLLVCMESGLALDAALARVCAELRYAHPMMTDELNQTRMELTMLNDREKALTNFARRTDLLAVKSLVATLLQSEKFGTSLVDTLRVLSDDYRQTRMMVAEEKAGKLPTKITVTTLPFMLMALLTLIVSPAAIQIMQEVKRQNSSKHE